VYRSTARSRGREGQYSRRTGWEWSALRTEEYFAERAAQGDIKKALRVLRRAGKGNAPVPGDELPRKTTRRRG